MLASEPPLKAKPSTSLPFFGWIFLPAATRSSQVFGNLDVELLEPVRAVEDGAGAAAPRQRRPILLSIVSSPQVLRDLRLVVGVRLDDLGDVGEGFLALPQAATWSLPISVTSGPSPPASCGGELVVHRRSGRRRQSLT